MTSDEFCRILRLVFDEERAGRSDKLGWVYYLRKAAGGSSPVKIGWTTNLIGRISTHRNRWPSCRLVAVELGPRWLEGARHSQFRHCAIEHETDHEVFAYEPDLRAHVAALGARPLSVRMFDVEALLDELRPPSDEEETDSFCDLYMASIGQTAKFLGLDRREVKQLLEEGALPYRQVGQTMRISAPHLITLMSDGPSIRTLLPISSPTSMP